MPPAGDEQRRRDMTASFETLHLQPPPPPPPPTPKSNIPISVGLDLVMKILLRLPTRSQIRFKSVCKKWRSLISSDDFSHQCILHGLKLQQSLILQHSGHGPDPDFFYWNPTSINAENAMIPYKLTTGFPHHHYHIQQACNGLLLLVGDDGGDYYFGRRVYRVYDLITRLSSEVNPANYDEDHDVVAMALAFDPSKSPYYKLICIICSPWTSSYHDAHTYRVEVYGSESRSWKLSLGPFTLPSKFYYREAQYWNNAIYWWHPNMATFYWFDIAKNEMKSLTLPSYHLNRDFHLQLGGIFPFPPYHLKRDFHLQELDGRLYYLASSFRVSYGSYGLLVKVWELRGFDDEWILKHDDVFACECTGKCVRLMGRANEDLVVLIYHQSAGKMRSYNFVDKRCEDVVDFNSPPFDYYSYAKKYYYPPFDYDAYHLKAFRFGRT